MPLSGLERVRDWIDNANPSTDAVLVVVQFVIDISERPWSAPSRPIEELSDRPDSEVRSAALPGSGRVVATVWYRQHFRSGLVELIAVASE